MKMLSALLVALAFTLSLSAPAFAGKCPKLVKSIDAKLMMTNLSEEDKEKVHKLRDQGEALHKAGKHADSVKTLNAALAIIGS